MFVLDKGFSTAVGKASNANTNNHPKAKQQGELIEQIKERCKVKSAPNALYYKTIYSLNKLLQLPDKELKEKLKQL